MSYLRALRQELFKYQKRKRRSIDGSVPGISHERFLKFTTPDLGTSRSQGGRYPHDLYMADNPTHYRPNMFSPAVDWTEYQQDEDGFIPLPRTPQNRHPLDMPLPENPLPHHSSDELSMTEQLLMNMGARPRPQEGPIPVDMEEIRHLLEGVRAPLHALDARFDTDSEQAIPFTDGIRGRLHVPENEQNHMLPDLELITETLNILQDRLPEDHPDIMNLRQAQKQLGWQQLSEIQQSPEFWQQYERIDDKWQSNLGEGNPYESADLIETQTTKSTAEYNASASMHDSQEVEMIDAPMPKETPYEAMLEEIVEQEYEQLQFETGGVGMIEPEAVSGSPMGIADAGQSEQFMGLDVFDTNPAFDEINQAIDQVTQFEQPQPDPWKQQYDPYQQMAMTMDMQMQYMMDPYYMMPGQMGPMMGPM